MQRNDFWALGRLDVILQQKLRPRQGCSPKGRRQPVYRLEAGADFQGTVHAVQKRSFELLAKNDRPYSI